MCVRGPPPAARIDVVHRRRCCSLSSRPRLWHKAHSSSLSRACGSSILLRSCRGGSGGILPCALIYVRAIGRFFRAYYSIRSRARRYRRCVGVRFDFRGWKGGEDVVACMRARRWRRERFGFLGRFFRIFSFLGSLSDATYAPPPLLVLISRFISRGAWRVRGWTRRGTEWGESSRWQERINDSIGFARMFFCDFRRSNAGHGEACNEITFRSVFCRIVGKISRFMLIDMAFG